MIQATNWTFPEVELGRHAQPALSSHSEQAAARHHEMAIICGEKQGMLNLEDVLDVKLVVRGHSGG